MSLTNELKQRARELGFSAIGVTGAERFSEAEAAAAERTVEGLLDGLSWWSKDRVHASADPRRATPDWIRFSRKKPLPQPSSRALSYGSRWISSSGTTVSKQFRA